VTLPLGAKDNQQHHRKPHGMGLKRVAFSTSLRTNEPSACVERP
jgi:hypothetical protein